jgi:quercetin dioxygenase-like cupin family protein
MAHRAYHYEMPVGAQDRPKMAVDVERTELLSVGIQVINAEGGETNLHAHNGEDAVWIVLGGQAAFYDENNARTLLSAHEMIVMPSGTKYWFEAAGDELLEIVRVGAKDPRVAPSRTDVTSRDRVARVGATPHVQARPIESVSV